MSTFVLYNKGEKESSQTKNYGLKKVELNIFKKLMHNDLHKKFKFETESTKMEEQLGINLESSNGKIEIIPMPELTEEQVTKYLDTFNDEPDNLDAYAEYLSIIMYEQVSPNDFNVKKKLDNLLEGQNCYWENPSNCKHSSNDKFKERRFNYMAEFTSNIDLINSTIMSNKSVEEVKTNYLNDIIRETNWVDLNIKSNYYIPKVSNMSNQEIVELYKQIPSDYLKYSFVCNMIVSRRHCHLILNNKEMLEMIAPMISKYETVFKYLIGYAWVCFRNEETIMKTKIKDDERFIFDIDTASKLPVFPFTFKDINLNPYAAVLLDKELINMEKNCMALNMIKNYKKYYGVCDSQEFIRRLKLFVNSNNQMGVLDCIDWNHCVISGSVMTACGMKCNPLLDMCKANPDTEITDADINLFFLNYYSGSDVDLICNHTSIYDFIECVNKFINDITTKYGKAPTVENVHTGTIILSDEIIGYEMDGIKKALGENSIDIEFVKKNFSNQMIKNYFYDKYYVPWKNDILSKNTTNIGKYTYDEYLKPIPREEFRIYSLSYEIDEMDNTVQDYEKYFYIKDIFTESTEQSNKLVAKLSESIRFKVSSNHFKTFEIFKARDENFFSIVSRFHMGFVRAYFNGTTVKCLPSYITSMMLQLSTDYKYFASIRDPVEIVNKYRSRGFGIILNDHEKVHMVYYNGFKPKNGKENKWIDVYNINMKNKQSIESMFGPRKSSDELFKPGKYFNGLPGDIFQVVNHETLSTVQDIKNCYRDNDKILPYFDLKTVNDKGFINPLDKYIIKMGWIKMNSEMN